MLQAGDKAPEIVLQDQTGKQRRLSEMWAAGPVVLYFYPKDETSGCTAEACSFRDAYETFKDAGAEVVGVSKDGVADHASFAQNHRLPFVLLADVQGAARNGFGVKRTFGIIDGRVTFVIDTTGTIRHVFDSMLRPRAHIDEALEVVKRLKTSQDAGR